MEAVPIGDGMKIGENFSVKMPVGTDWYSFLQFESRDQFSAVHVSGLCKAKGMVQLFSGRIVRLIG